MLTESAQMKEIFERFKNNTTSINNISIENLDELVEVIHSFDAAVDLHFYHGYEYFMNLIDQMKDQFINNKTFNSTVFKHIMHIFIYSAQNNDKVKEIFLKTSYNSFLLKLIDFMIDYNMDQSNLLHIAISMKSFLKFCPVCLGNFLDHADYNHTIKKLLLLSPNPDNKIVNIVYSILNYAFEEKKNQINLNQSDPNYNFDVDLLYEILEKIIENDNICQILTNHAHHVVPKFNITVKKFDPQLITLLNNLMDFCPNMAYNSDIDYILQH